MEDDAMKAQRYARKLNEAGHQGLRWNAGEVLGKAAAEESLVGIASGTDGHDPVNHPAHYTSHPARCECGAGIECITIARNCNFCVGNAIKYLWRAGLKGDAIEDLRKAAWYINDEIARLEKEATR